MCPSGSVPSRRARIFVWTGAVVFALSLTYFLYAYFVTFGETAGSPGGWSAVADVVLFSAFALHHSLFAREAMRARIARLVRPELERSLYVWIASLLFLVVCASWMPVAGVAWHTDGVVAWMLRAVQVFGVWLTLRSAAVIDVFELAGIKQLRSVAGDLQVSGPPEFKTTGPYGWVRHPIYSGWCLLVFATPTMTMTKLVFAVTSVVYLLIAIPFEERSLLATTGAAYRTYMRAVRRKLVPGIY